MSNNSMRPVRINIRVGVVPAVLGCLMLMMSSAFAAERVDLTGLQSSPNPYRFIIKFHEQSAEYSNATIRQQALDQAARALPAARGKSLLAVRWFFRMGIGADVITTSRRLDAVDATTLLRQIALNPNVEYVEVDAIFKPMFVPNDSRYGEQWHYYEPVGGINLPKAWDLANGTGVVVAVLDTGITKHSDLDANVVTGYDFVSDLSQSGDGTGRDTDPSQPDAGCNYWHGSHVAGTVAAVTNNGNGVAGVAYQAKISPVRVLGLCFGWNSDLVDAITWASGGTVSGVPANVNQAKVLNLSLQSLASCSSTMQAAIDGAVQRGSTLVVAAGNTPSSVSGSPASCNNVIVVAANDREGNQTVYSSNGPLVDVTAPGGDTDVSSNKGVLSTFNSGMTLPAGESYEFVQGTSMAAPHVAGIAALIQSKYNPDKTPAEVESILKCSARPMPGVCVGGCGAGIVDAFAALTTTPATGNPPIASFTAQDLGNSTVKFTGSISYGNIKSQLWDFGDPNTDVTMSTETNPTHVYPGPGVYFVKFSAMTDVSCFPSATITKKVTVAATTTNIAPVAKFSFTTNLLTATFTDLSTDSDGTIASRLWNFGDSTATSSTTNPVHTYAVCGTYNVTLTVTDNAGATNALTKPMVLRCAVNATPVAAFTYYTQGNTVAERLTAYFTDKSTDSDGTIVSRIWDFGDGSMTTSIINPTHTYAAIGFYGVTLTVTDNKGATKTTTQTVSVGFIP